MKRIKPFNLCEPRYRDEKWATNRLLGLLHLVIQSKVDFEELSCEIAFITGHLMSERADLFPKGFFDDIAKEFSKEKFLEEQLTADYNSPTPKE